MPFGEALSEINPTFLEDEVRYKKIFMEEIPIMITEDDTLVCIPKDNEVFACAICGTSGSGKTLMLNRFHTFLRKHWDCNVAIMNDISEETYNWSKYMKNQRFNRLNEVLLQQNPFGSSIVYLFPNTSTIKIPEDMIHHPHLKIVLPFDEIIEDIGKYVKGVNPEFDLGKSGIYINDIKDELKECDTPLQVEACLREKLPEEKGFREMKIKILTAFQSLFKEEILDLTNKPPEFHSYLRLEGTDFISNPITTIMKAGHIPSLITSDLSTKKYSDEYLSYYIKSLFQNNLKDFGKQKTFLLFDELASICKREDDSISQAIGQVAARGRINNIGLIYVTQFYNKIPTCVKGAKLNYLFTFSHSDSDIISEISSDFDLDKTMKSQIKNLKKFQVIGMTRNKFVFYSCTGQRWEDNRPVIGTILFPLADHKKV